MRAFSRCGNVLLHRYPVTPLAQQGSGRKLSSGIIKRPQREEIIVAGVHGRYSRLRGLQLRLREFDDGN